MSSLKSRRMGLLARPGQIGRFVLLGLLSCGVSLSGCALGSEPAPPKAPRPAAGATARERPDTTPQGPGDLQDIQSRVTRLVPRITACTVAVRVGSSQGTGVVVSRDGYVLTAGHVAEKPGLKADFTFSDGRTYAGQTLGAHQGVDAGLCRITDPGQWKWLEMGRSEDLVPGTWCLALGHSLGYQEGRPPVVRLGRILFAQHSVLQTDCTLVSGDSGGPLVDLQGQVIGINSRVSGLGSMNFHVPIDVFRENWERLKQGELWQVDRAARESPAIQALFAPVVAPTVAAVVRISYEERNLALGTVVARDGWVVTKASELAEENGQTLICETADGCRLEARVVATDPEWDLALVKVDATDLTVPSWNERPDDTVGRWVAVPGLDDDAPLAIGVLSTPRRAIPPATGVLGVAIDDSERGPRITRVNDNGPADKAGFLELDVITHINEQRVRTEADVIAILKRTQVGETLEIAIRRGAAAWC